MTKAKTVARPQTRPQIPNLKPQIVRMIFTAATSPRQYNSLPRLLQGNVRNKRQYFTQGQSNNDTSTRRAEQIVLVRRGQRRSWFVKTSLVWLVTPLIHPHILYLV